MRIILPPHLSFTQIIKAVYLHQFSKSVHAQHFTTSLEFQADNESNRSRWLFAFSSSPAFYHLTWVLRSLFKYSIYTNFHSQFKASILPPHLSVEQIMKAIDRDDFLHSVHAQYFTTSLEFQADYSSSLFIPIFTASSCREFYQFTWLFSR